MCENNDLKSELEAKDQDLTNLETNLTEREKEIKILNEKINNLTKEKVKLLSNLDDLKYIVNKVKPETISEINKERDKGKVENEILEKLKSFSRLSSDHLREENELRRMKYKAISLGLKKSTIDKIDGIIVRITKAKDQFYSSTVVVGSTKTPQKNAPKIGWDPKSTF